MGRNLLFVHGSESELVELSESLFEIVERRMKFGSRIVLDRNNALAICHCMKIASDLKGKVSKSWKHKSQSYLYHIFENFNLSGTYMRGSYKRGW